MKLPSEIKNEFIKSLEDLSADDFEFHENLALETAKKRFNGFASFLEYEEEVKKALEEEDSQFVNNPKRADILKNIQDIKTNINLFEPKREMLNQLLEEQTQNEKLLKSREDEIQTLRKLNNEAYKERINQLSAEIEISKQENSDLKKKITKQKMDLIPASFREHRQLNQTGYLKPKLSEEELAKAYLFDLELECQKLTNELTLSNKEAFQQENSKMDWLHDLALDFGIFGEKNFYRSKKYKGGDIVSELFRNIPISPPKDWLKKIDELADPDKSEFSYGIFREKFLEFAITLLNADFSTPLLVEQGEWIYPLNNFLGTRVAIYKTGTITKSKLKKDNLWILSNIKNIEIIDDISLKVPDPLLWITPEFSIRFNFFPGPGNPDFLNLIGGRIRARRIRRINEMYDDD